MAELVEVTGIVIASGPIGEYDKRVVLLTRELGKISAFARGARRPGNHLMAACESFAFGTFILYPGKSSYTVEKADISNYFRELAAELTGAYYGYYFMELADYYARENENGGEMVKLLYYSFKALLDERIPNKLVRAVYELKQLVLNGQYPDFFSCGNCGEKEELAGFSIMTNSLVCSRCRNQKGVIPVSASTVYALQFIVSVPVERLFTFTVTEEVLRELIRVMHLCMEAYVDRRMKSLEILAAIEQ